MRIFIASSKKHLGEKEYGSPYETDYSLIDDKSSLAVRITKTLRQDNKGNKLHTVKPWWENGVIEFGENFLDSLIKLSKNCNAGVFIFGKDDKLETYKYTVRDNVLIECGMFLSKYGPSKSCILYEQWDDESVKIPFNVEGIKNIPFNKSDSESIEKALQEVKRIFNKKDRTDREIQKISFNFNVSKTKQIIREEYKSWESKSLYIGHQSARKWKNIENDKNYDGNIGLNIFADFFNHTEHKFTSPPIENVISLGCGIGKIDRLIIDKVYAKNGNHNLKYIPIDLNSNLALMAAENVFSLNTDISVPFAIIDDFEDNNNHIGHIILDEFAIKEQKNLYMMMGGTFTNLNNKEDTFVNCLLSWMSNNDYLLLDIFTKSLDYSFEDDLKRFDIKETLLQQEKTLKIKEAELIANAIHNKYPQTKKRSVRGIAHNINEYVERLLISYEGDVPYTSEIDYCYRGNGATLFTARRYFFDDFKYFLEKKFAIVTENDGLKNSSKIHGRGTFLVRKKTEKEIELFNTINVKKEQLYSKYRYVKDDSSIFFKNDYYKELQSLYNSVK